MNPIRIIIVGAGFGGIYALKRFHQLFHKNKNIHITLISEKNYFLFTPLLHEVATGGINQENIVEPIRKVLGCCLDTLYLGKVTEVDFEKSALKTSVGNLSYDYLVLAPGALTNFFNTPGAEEYSFSLKSLDDARRFKNHCISSIERSSHISDRDARRNALRFIVVGGGPTGVELVAELQEFLKHTFSRYYSRDMIDDISVVLIQKGPELLPQFSKPLRTKSLETLRRKGIEVRLETEVVRVAKKEIKLGNGDILKTETVVWVAGIQPVTIPFIGGAEQDKSGRLVVNKYLQLKNYQKVYAIGDVAFVDSGKGGPLPSLAQVAVQEARVVADNIERQINNQTLTPFVYKSSGTLVSLGQWMAVGEISSFVLWGHLTWWIWRTTYLSKLISWQKKVKVAVGWTINIFSQRDISEI